MKTRKINIIGAGNLGKTITRLFAMHTSATIAGVCNTSYVSSLQATQFIGAGIACADFSALPPADITLITTPDDKIAACCELLINSKNFNAEGIIVHCSGLLTADALIAAKRAGCHIISVHPMHSFADPQLSLQNFAGSYCAVEGDTQAKPVVDLFEQIGGNIIYLEKHHKALYHAAGTLACNYLITLADTAINSLILAGIAEEDAKNMVVQLMGGTVKNLANSASAAQALTGPLKRGDLGTIKQHLLAIEDNQIKALYKRLGNLTLKLTDLEPNNQKKFQDLF